MRIRSRSLYTDYVSTSNLTSSPGGSINREVQGGSIVGNGTGRFSPLPSSSILHQFKNSQVLVEEDLATSPPKDSTGMPSSLNFPSSENSKIAASTPPSDLTSAL